MSNTFSMQRFLMLFNKYTKEHYRIHLMSIGALVGILFIVLGYMAYMSALKMTAQAEFFVLFLILAGCVYTSTVFQDLGQKSKALNILTLPVSNFERFLVRWIYSFVVFQVVFILSFYLVNAAVISIANSYKPLHEKQMMIDWTSADFNYYTFFFSWFLHSATFLGSIFFNKLHFVKSALVLLSFGFILLLTNQLVIQVIIDPNMSATLPLHDVVIQENGIFHFFENTSSKRIIIGFMLLSGTPCLWSAAYFKLKEKQV